MQEGRFKDGLVARLEVGGRSFKCFFPVKGVDKVTARIELARNVSDLIAITKTGLG